MAFKKKTKNVTKKQAKPNKPKKQKASLFGGGKKAKKQPKVAVNETPSGTTRRKSKTLISRMGLSDAVASMGLNVLFEMTKEPSAVRLLDDGYTVVVLTEDMLVDSGLQPGDESFGSFAEALRSEQIKSLLLQTDLNNNKIVIIPDADSLDLLDEFSFARQIDFKWGLVPVDITDDSEVIVTESTVRLSDLINISNNETPIHQKGDGSIIVGESDEDVLANSDVDVDPAVFDETDVPEESGDESEFETSTDVEYPTDEIVDDTFEVTDAFNFGDDDDTEIEQTPQVEDDFPTNDQELDPELDDSVFEHMDETNAKELVDEVISREFYNDELGIKVDPKLFDLHFDNKDTKLALFNETPLDDSELSRHVAKMHADANIEMTKFHNDNIQELRSIYNLAMSKSHDSLVDMLNYNDESTDYGKRYTALQENREAALNAFEDIALAERQRIENEYNIKRDKFGQRAYDDAVHKYDDLYLNDNELLKTKREEQMRSEVNAESDAHISDMYAERRIVARRMYDKASTSILVKLQQQYKEMVAREIQFQDSFRNDIDKFIRENYANDVMRNKALAEELRQKHKADEVRQEYKVMLKAKEDELAQAKISAESEIADLRNKHQTDLSNTIAEWTRKVDEANEQNVDLKKSVDTLQSQLSTMDSEINSKYQAQIETGQNQIKALTDQLAYAEERTAKAGRLQMVIVVAVAIAAVALGLIGGFVMASHGDNKTTTQPVQTVQSQGSNAQGGTTYNNYYGDKSESKGSDKSESKESDQQAASKSSEAKSSTTDKK